MGFPVRDAWVFNVVHPGDTVQATLVVATTLIWKTSPSPSPAARPIFPPPRPSICRRTGETAPDFRFLNQDGRPIHLAQFRGEPLLLTFIYSRCPLPDYCVRMSNNFVEIARTLQRSNPAAFAKLQMLSITLDPGLTIPRFCAPTARLRRGRRSQPPALELRHRLPVRDSQDRRILRPFLPAAERSGHPQPAHRPAGLRWQTVRTLSGQPVEARRSGRPASGVAKVTPQCSTQQNSQGRQACLLQLLSIGR